MENIPISITKIESSKEINIKDATITEFVSVEGKSIEIRKVILTKDDKKIIIEREAYGQHEINREKEELNNKLNKLADIEIIKKRNDIQSKLNLLDAIEVEFKKLKITD